jgi:hypothetical protein
MFTQHQRDETYLPGWQHADVSLRLDAEIHDREALFVAVVADGPGT